MKRVYATPQRVVDRLMALNRSQEELERLRRRPEKAKKSGRSALAQNFTRSAPFSARICRASSGVAIW